MEGGAVSCLGPSPPPTGWAPLLPPRPLPLDLTWCPDRAPCAPLSSTAPGLGSGLRPGERCCPWALLSPSLTSLGPGAFRGGWKQRWVLTVALPTEEPGPLPSSPLPWGSWAAQAPPCPAGAGPRVLFSRICSVPTGLMGTAGRLRGDRLQSVNSSPRGAWHSAGVSCGV